MRSLVGVCRGEHLSPDAPVPAEGTQGNTSPSSLNFHHAVYLAPFYFLFLLVSSVFKMALKLNDEVLSSDFKCKKTVIYLIGKIHGRRHSNVSYMLFAVSLMVYDLLVLT